MTQLELRDLSLTPGLWGSGLVPPGPSPHRGGCTGQEHRDIQPLLGQQPLGPAHFQKVELWANPLKTVETFLCIDHSNALVHWPFSSTWFWVIQTSSSPRAAVLRQMSNALPKSCGLKEFAAVEKGGNSDALYNVASTTCSAFALPVS